jgi:predicted DCC family thiol-disulfide oxidoreductase YuxK
MQPSIGNGEKERVLTGADAALEVARYLDGWWKLALLARALPRAAREAAYTWFARNRFRVGGKAEECDAPGPEERGRFLDLAP